MKLNLPANVCDPQRLEAFLSGDMSDVQEREFAVHLNSCENCRQSLAEQAAEPEAWREAEMLLKPPQFDDCGLGTATQSTRQPLQIQNVLDALGPTDDPEKLGRLGGYEVSGVVGAGGMGVVLKAIDKSLDRTVAIKVLAPHLASSGAARKRFAREAKAAAAVLHPNVIAIHSVSNDETLPYLVMPYVRGTSLQKRLDQEGPLPLQEILRIGGQIAAGLAAAHGQGLVHRDIKPANILLEEGVERVTITDFGLARAVDDATITHSGMIAGTPQFMSPEQARGEPVGPGSDLFSLGSVLYAICTGRPPFRAETSYGVMRRITDDEPNSIREINPEIPEWLCQVISKLMSKRASDRFESAAKVAELLEACLAHVQQPASALLPPSLVTEPRGRRFLSISRRSGVIAMLSALALGLLGMFAWQTSEAPDIAGKWAGPDWGEVVLSEMQPGEYEGTYTDTFKKTLGAIQLKWSRVERCYKGTWREGKDRSGKISLRLLDDEIRGAWTTSKKSEINSGTPELADLTWTRANTAGIESQDEYFGPVIEREVRNREAIDFDTGRQAMIPNAELNPEKGLLWILEERLASLTKWMNEEHMDAVSEGSSLTTFGLKVNELANSDWESINPPKLRDALKVDWQKENPRQFARAIDTIDPKSPPHAILALRTAPRTIAFQTREGGMGILQIMEITKAGFKIRFKLAASEAAKKSTVVPVVSPGIRVQVLLSLETHTREMLRKNVGFGELSIMGSGLTGIINGKRFDNVQAVMAHRCRLESFEEAEQGTMKKCWKATLFVPQGPTDDGSNRDLSQEKMDALHNQGVQFWLDHYRNQPAITPNPKQESPQVKKPRAAVLTPEQVDEDGEKFDSGAELTSNDLCFSETMEIVLSMNSSKFMLDLDTGKTMDPPATIRPEQKQMDVHPDQVQPYHYPKELIGMVLQGLEVKESDWDASAADVRRALAGENVTPLTHMDLGPEKRPTYFFKTSDGAMGVLQLLGIVDEPKGIRLRFKAVAATELQAPAQPAEESEPVRGEPMNQTEINSVALKRLRQFPISHRVGAIACSTDGELIAIANSDVTFPLTSDWRPTVKVLDGKTGMTVALLSLATDEQREALLATDHLPHFEVGPLVFSPDGSVLAISTGLGQVKLFNPRSGELIHSLDDEKARLADKATPEKLRDLPRAMGRITSLAFSPDGSLLAACGESIPDVAGHWDRIERGGLGKRSSTGPGRVKVWDAKAGKLKHDLPGHSHAFGVAFSPDGPWLASAGRWATANSDGNGVLLWDLEKGQIHRTILIEANGGTHAVVFSPTKKLAAIGSIIFDKENDTRATALGVAYPLSGNMEWQQVIQGGAMPKAFLPNGKSIIVLSGRNSVRVIDAESGQSQHEIKAEEGSFWIDLVLASKAGILVIARAAEEPRGSVEIWDIAGTGGNTKERSHTER